MEPRPGAVATDLSAESIVRAGWPCGQYAGETDLTRVGAALVFSLAGAASADELIDAATFSQPTARYDHAVLGDGLEWAALDLKMHDGRRLRFRLPENRVFEDLMPRLADLDGDGLPEVVVVETDVERGAMLAVYDASGLRSTTAPIGQRHRWLAPAAIGDLDNDGQVEIAYVDRPHLDRELVVVRLEGDQLLEIARLGGLTNHKIGEAIIHGGLRNCGSGAELVLADPEWTSAFAADLDENGLFARRIGPITSAGDLDLLLQCP